jgi:hypothetical protein
MRHITSLALASQTAASRASKAMFLILVLAIVGCQQTPNATTPLSSSANAPVSPIRAELMRESAAIASITQEPITLDWLAGVKHLPSIATRTLYRNKSTRVWLTQKEYEASGLKTEEVNTVPFDEKGYYATFYGTPIAYTLVLDIMGQLGYKTLKGLKITDYGYGAIGPARLSAAAGAEVVGLDVDPMLGKLYNQTDDQGIVADRSSKDKAQQAGKLSLVHKPFPNDKVAIDAAALSDLIISKNTLKKGFVRPTTGKAMIDLGMSSDQYLKGFANALKPGGYLIIYNISQKLDPNNYRASNDGASPFTPDEYAAAGFKVIFFEQVDHDKVRRLGQALGWGGPQGMGDLNTNLFAQYTVVQRLQTSKAL